MMGSVCRGEFSLDDVEVGAADGAASHPEPHFARPRLRFGEIPPLERRRFDGGNVFKNHGFHRVYSTN